MYSPGERVRPLSDFEWNLRWTILPHKCAMSGEPIRMFKLAYKGIHRLYGPAGEPPITTYKWLSANEYLFLKIKGTI